MRLCSFELGGDLRAGAVIEDEVVDLSGVRDLPARLEDIIAAGATAGEAIKRAIAREEPRRSLSQVSLAAPVRPSKFFAIGLNYATHAAESGQELPATVTVIGKATSSVSGPFDPIQRPTASDQLDYEGELGFVIGTRCRHVSSANAPSVIAGYVIVNDVSVRDWQLRTSQWTIGKSFDSHGPFGPWIVTPDEIGDPHSLELRTYVNEELRQRGNTGDLIFNCYEIVEHITTACTLEPGDLIATGTPAGVALGLKDQPWLQPGDTVRVECDRIGAIESEIVQEDEGAWNASPSPTQRAGTGTL